MYSPLGPCRFPAEAGGRNSRPPRSWSHSAPHLFPRSLQSRRPLRQQRHRRPACRHSRRRTSPRKPLGSPSERIPKQTTESAQIYPLSLPPCLLQSKLLLRKAVKSVGYEPYHGKTMQSAYPWIGVQHFSVNSRIGRSEVG